MKLDYVRNEIARMRGQIRAQECEIEMLRRAGVGAAAAELLLVRMRAKIDDLHRERETLRLNDSTCSRRYAQKQHAGFLSRRVLASEVFGVNQHPTLTPQMRSQSSA